MDLRTRIATVVLAAAVAAITGGCGNAQGTATPRASTATGGQPTQVPGGSVPVASVPVGATAGPGGGGGQGSDYTAGAGTATVTVAGTEYRLTGGTCKEDSTVLPVFELVIGGLDDPEHLDVYVADMSTPIHDGEYQGGLTLVTIGAAGQVHAVQARVILTDGLTKGSFSGTSAGNNPVDVSGTFAC